jgi:hypothetical protein
MYKMAKPIGCCKYNVEPVSASLKLVSQQKDRRSREYVLFVQIHSRFGQCEHSLHFDFLWRRGCLCCCGRSSSFHGSFVCEVSLLC